MLNILESRQFFYDNDEKSVTVYQDDEDLNLWYIVPEPTYATQGGVPQFSLVEYTTNEGKGGNCSFIVELTVSPAARQAVHDNLGPDIQIGQLDWVTAESFFTYTIEGEDTLVNVTPSNYSNNQAAFVIHLPDSVAIETFKNAFGPQPGKTSTPFLMQYDVTALTRLQAVKATVSYNSQIAFDYEKQVDIDKNIWGKETSRKTTIKETLQNSDAGDTEIVWGIPDPDPELEQRVNDWAWVTLEGLVNKVVDDALKLLGEQNADKFSLNSTNSFTRTFEEKTVIEWVIQPTTLLPAFDQATWEKVFSTSDHRNLETTFTVMDMVTEEVTVQSVTVEVNYQDQSRDTHTFTPDSDAGWRYAAPGVLDSKGNFVPSYQYRYIVTFKDQPDATFTSDWIETEATEINLPLASLGILAVTFRGSNINFEIVDFVLLDFFFVKPGNTPNKSQQVRITDNTTDHKVESFARLPFTNNYEYSLTYVLKDGTQYKMAPVTTNANNVTLATPFIDLIFTVMLVDPKKKIDMVQLTGRYEDSENNIQRSDTFLLTETDRSDNWTIPAINNPNGSVIEYDGIVIFKDGKQRTVANIRSQERFLNISPTQELFSVTVDVSQIDWDGACIDLVQANLYTLDENDNKQVQRSFAIRADTPTQYWTFTREVGKAATYYYDIAYFHEDKTTTYVEQTEGDNTLLVLPPDGTKEEFTRVRVDIPLEFVPFLN